jgi:PTS system nitrogen regulatory IIA component
MELAFTMNTCDDRPRPAGASARQLNEWLQPQDIVLDVDVWDRRRALELAAARIGQVHGLDPAPILRALLRREQIGSTAIGQGVAIPHARIAGIARPLTLFMRPKIAMDFDAPDGKPVSNLLVIMVPADGATDDHLQLLALVAQAFSDPAFRSRLSAASNATEVTAVFDQWTENRPV